MADLQKMRKLSTGKLRDRLKDSYESMTNMRFQKVLGDLEYPQKLREVKKEIAQIKTILREQELASKEND
jgi:large subunit ribosomal protein L29